MILFLSKYPQTEIELRDGFFQRIESIDHFFLGEQRTYLDVSLFQNLKKNITSDEERVHISCNIFIHFFLILGLFRKSSLIYIQSIYNAIYVIFLIPLFNKNYVLDLHGVVPEELAMKNKLFHAKIANFVEYILFKKIKICIAVTNKMVGHYQLKYPQSRCQFIVYAILPSHLKIQAEKVLKMTSEKIEVIYSGNMQIWQNIDLMLNSIKNSISNKINFTILTGEPEKFLEKMKELNIPTDKIVLKSVKPEELSDYYSGSHYGFILRDDILVNRVACPTKIVEYLAHGITPIVLSEKIGDFEDYGYEYIYLNQLNEDLEVYKSQKNVEAIRCIFEKNDFNLKLEINRMLFK